MLTCDDPYAVRCALIVARDRLELTECRDRNQAVLNANAIGEMLGG